MHLIEPFVELWHLKFEGNVAHVLAIFADVGRSGTDAIDEGVQCTAVCENTPDEHFVHKELDFESDFLAYLMTCPSRDKTVLDQIDLTQNGWHNRIVLIHTHYARKSVSGDVRMTIDHLSGCSRH